MTNQWIAALILATLVAVAAIRARALTPGGGIAAILLGTVVVGGGGWWPGVALMVFFVSSSLISRLLPSNSTEDAKGDRRDWIQVLANGWGVLLGCILFGITGWQPWLLFGLGAIAAATSDTWSSEIGRTSTSPPRLITTGKVVLPGTSGAVSTRGFIAALAGSALIAGVVLIGALNSDFLNDITTWKAIIGIVLAGFIGGLLDSILGATVQEQRCCSVCNVRTEANPHSCGNETQVVAGIQGVNNDVVNFVCVMAGALIGLISGIL